MATKNKIDLKNDRKEILFDDFYRAAVGTMEALESQYGVTGVMDQIFGIDACHNENSDFAKANLRKNPAWTRLLEMYDYALHGIVSATTEEMSIVIDGSDVLKLASSENWWPSNEWDEIVAMSDGRYALDDGQHLTIPKLALLAKIDQRTVRNAISAGQLVAKKRTHSLYPEQIFVDNASARQWLFGRKGFKPTLTSGDEQHLALSSVTGPAEFGVFLSSQRKKLGLDAEDGKLVVFHAGVNPHAIALLEAGIFSLPLDAVFPLADFYQVSRKELLDVVMGVFFNEELAMLSAAEDNRSGDQT